MGSLVSAPDQIDDILDVYAAIDAPLPTVSKCYTLYEKHWGCYIPPNWETYADYSHGIHCSE